MRTKLVNCLSAGQIETDVVVVGGGATGVAAAVTAARQGQRVVLVERYGFCGGGAVAGLSGTVCGLYLATDRTSAAPEQLVFGFADEFCRLLDGKGGLSGIMRYGHTWTRVHEPLAWRDVADGLLVESAVTVIYHAVAVGVLMEGGQRIDGVQVWTKQGLLTIRAGVTIDASGDADVVAMAGLPSFVGDGGRVQNPTMIFRLQGVDVPAFVSRHGVDTIMDESVGSLIRAQSATGRYQLPRSKIWLFPTTRPGELLCNCTRVTGSDGRELNTLFHQDFTEAEINGRRQVHEYARFFRDHLAGCQNAYVNDTGVQVGVRQTRQAEGVAKLKNSDILLGAKSASSVARSAWPIELHAGAKPRVEWLLDDYYDVPYECFVPQYGEGLLVAGRCLSAEHEAVASARVTAQCFSYGHAAGHAAALALRDKVTPRVVDPAALRERMNAENARI